ncbi:hypothetical protein Poli38472_009863 [Pythium oligandrum]|uniref:Uncharacterized protein n=1 Tax=Pythium oligandrum TaxID=41045 RepID=A0A8K1FG46_PYTOL|nr:hypothetical protein Poli38472_009863 [Pythium oligandrum]|eukprot:TMW62370.1 hypothetical protein Poli38472_009863 [Pythium oligandrum]
MTMERRCHVRHEEREVVMRFSVDDAVEALLHAAIQRFEEENTTPGFDRKAMVGLRSLRLGKDLFLEACVDELVKDDDVLEMRPYTVTPPSASVQDSTLPSDGSLTMPCAEQQNALGMVLTSPGLFVLQILQALQK